MNGFSSKLLTPCSFDVINSTKKPTLPFQILITNEHGSVRLPEGYKWPKSDEWYHWFAYNELGLLELTGLSILEVLISQKVPFRKPPNFEELSQELGYPALLSNSSRLIIDVNRPLDSPTLFRENGDGKAIQLNKGI